MGRVLILIVGLLFCGAPAQALHLDEALKIVQMDNEQVVAGIADDRFAAEVVAKLEAGKEVPEDELKRAYKYCADTLALINTPKLRKKALDRLMAKIDDDIMVLLMNRGGSADSQYYGRMKSNLIRKRLKSLLEFEAERYRRFLGILGDDC